MPDEPSDAAQELYLQALEPNDVFHAPQLWTWEMGNMLVMGAVRERITPDQVESGLDLLSATQISFDPRRPFIARHRSRVWPRPTG